MCGVRIACFGYAMMPVRNDMTWYTPSHEVTAYCPKVTISDVEQVGAPVRTGGVPRPSLKGFVEAGC